MTITSDRSPTTVNLKLTRGDHLDTEIIFVDGDGQLVDLTEYTPLGRLKGTTTSSVTELSLTKITSGVRIELTPQQTTTLDELSNYDIQFSDDVNGKRITPVAGTITLIAEVAV